MGEETAVTTPVDEQVEKPVVETPAPVDGATAETTTLPSETPDGSETEAHPLEPNGDRFKQVWARAKHAEAERETLRNELQREREERIRFEERLRAKDEQKTSQQEYTWSQLEAAIEAGQVTRAWANEYREGIVAKKAREEAIREVESRQQINSRESSVMNEISRYKQLVPEVLQPGTPERQKIEREYAYMVNTLGFKPGTATELAATRAALGDVETVERAAKAKQSTTREPFMETHSSTHKPQQKSSSLVDKLDSRQKAHYEKMISSGRYADWKEVEDELKWTPPKLGGRRG